METTTEKKKHKSGFALLKEKIAKLQEECNDWKTKYLKADADRQDAIDRYNRKQTDFVTVSKAHNILSEENQNQQDRICWLLKHASWFTLWKYKRQFKEGGKP